MGRHPLPGGAGSQAVSMARPEGKRASRLWCSDGDQTLGKKGKGVTEAPAYPNEPVLRMTRGKRSLLRPLLREPLPLSRLAGTPTATGERTFPSFQMSKDMHMRVNYFS